MQILELDPVVESDLGTWNEDVESLHLVCGVCFAADVHCPTLCGLVDEREVENKDYQNCVVCFDFLETRICPKGHALSKRM